MLALQFGHGGEPWEKEGETAPSYQRQVKSLDSRIRALKATFSWFKSLRLVDANPFEKMPTLSANRGTEPSQLVQLLRGELDWIVMRALEKDRSRRYETANAFAADVERYLAGEAVQAVPPSAGYRLRKFARRNRALVAATGAVVAALAVGAAVSVRFALEASRQAAAAKASAEEARDCRRTRGA